MLVTSFFSFLRKISKTDFRFQVPYSQWVLQVAGGQLAIISFREDDLDAKKIQDEYRFLAFQTRDPRNIAWLFTSLVMFLRHILGNTDVEDSVKPIASVTPIEFIGQYLDCWGITRDNMPDCMEFLEKKVEYMGEILDTFSGGKYRFRILKGVRLQCRLEHKYASSFWGIKVPSTQGGPLTNICSIQAPSNLRQKLDKVRNEALRTGNKNDIVIMWLYLERLVRGNVGEKFHEVFEGGGGGSVG